MTCSETAPARALTPEEAVPLVARRALAESRQAIYDNAAREASGEPVNRRELAMAIGSLRESCRALLALVEGRDPYGYHRD